MLILLIALNVILIVVVIFLLLRKPQGNESLAGSMEDVELLEFQQNLRKLIDELKITAELSVDKVNRAGDELDKHSVQAKEVLNELKYLIDRNKRQRSVEYKTEVVNMDYDVTKDTTNKVVDSKKIESSEKKSAKIAKMPGKKKDSKFVMKENVNSEVSGGQDKYERIHGLLKSGMKIDEIAAVTGITKGEVELIKNLKKK